ncbi:hypothetical protein RCOM_1318350 [Ricinus communis]|uniref:LapB rubredoxin metal binding domain-containing protein n=1 Tax=Ricinus communis TaxID=3988 RepID=B9T3U5_RICCO|nr:hypothetical protein RCOM_1318350 [Ricinus communis]
MIKNRYQISQVSKLGFQIMKRYASLKKADLVNNIVSNNNRKKGKSKVIYVCESCGNEDGQWWGICRSCGKAGTMKQFSDRDDRSGNSKVSGAEVTENMVRSWLPQKVSETQPLRLKDVNQRMNHLSWRIPLQDFVLVNENQRTNLHCLEVKLPGCLVAASFQEL